MALTTKEKQLLHTLKEAVITDVCNALTTPNLNDTTQNPGKGDSKRLISVRVGS